MKPHELFLSWDFTFSCFRSTFFFSFFTYLFCKSWILRSHEYGGGGVGGLTYDMNKCGDHDGNGSCGANGDDGVCVCV